MPTEEIEYIEPTKEHVGEKAEFSNNNTHWSEQTLLEVLPSDIKYRFLTKAIGSPRGFCSWEYARIARPLTYAERQAKCGLKVGDRVKFVREWSGDELGTTVEFIGGSGGMRREVGQIGLLTHIGKEVMRVQFATQYWYLPYFVLEKVEDRQPTALDHMAKVYVVGAPQDEFVICHMFSEIDGELRKAKHFAVVRSGDNRLVYELSNLRVKG